MSWVAPQLVGRIPIAALANPPALVELFAETITEELDFRLEAENMLDIAHAFALLDQRGYVIPRPHPELVTRRVLVMERLSGFKFDDVAGMKDAGVDTHMVVRTGMIGSMEGAMVHGIFHGDLHGGNLFVMPDGRTALMDFGITGRLSEQKRIALLRLLVGGSTNDLQVQLEALRDLGALPPDTDIAEVIRELGLDRPVVDPTTMTGDELLGEIQRTIKALLGIGAKLPKELMLFVKNMVFLDGAIATLAPDIDIIAEIAVVTETIAMKHGARIMEQLGMQYDPSWQADMTGFKASLGLTEDVDAITYRELQERREVIRHRLESRRPKTGSGRRRFGRK
jgi:ubiquinone biosynthesis protein